MTVDPEVAADVDVAESVPLVGVHKLEDELTRTQLTCFGFPSGAGPCLWSPRHRVDSRLAICWCCVIQRVGFLARIGRPDEDTVGSPYSH